MKYNAVVNGNRIDIEFQKKNERQIEARIGDRVYVLEAVQIAPEVYWFNWNNQSLEVALTRTADEYAISLGRQHVAVEILDARTALRRASQNAHDGLVELKSPMPGKIVRILVNEGSEVKANQGVVVMEAMKMQNEIKSPKAGIVRKIGVTEGLAVNAGQILATVE
jgi:biotin carboxyl carrier protein